MPKIRCTKMEYVLGIDLGTSYFKVGLFDHDGSLCGLGRTTVKKESGDGSSCELSAMRFWELLREALTDACRQANAETDDIKAAAYSSQANSFLLLDDNNEPLTPLILWPDDRTKQIYPEVQQLWDRDDFLQQTGIGIPAGRQFCVNKLLWFQKTQPQIWSSVNRIMTISDYLTFCLTGETVGDMGTASLLGLYDLQKKRWWSIALETLAIEPEQLSTPLLPGTIAGNVNSVGAEYLGLNTATPFAVGSLDHHIAAVGTGVGQIADISESTGTVLACLNFNKQYQPMDSCCLGPGIDGNGYYQLAFNANGASVLEWYQKKYAPDLSIEQLAGMAENIKPGSDGLLALASADKYDELNGFKNISDHHTPGHFVRAIMESTSASLAELVNELCGKEKPMRIAATGGGAKSELWLQIKADMLGAEFAVTNCIEPACFGAAILASIAANWFNSYNEAMSLWVSTRKTFQPNIQW